MKISFPYETETSNIFNFIKRPIAKVNFWSLRYKKWLEYSMIVDTGADYTLLPFSATINLGMDLEKDCKRYYTFGIGGSESVYLIKNLKIKLGNYETEIPVGFLERDDIPPLLGRHKCLDIFDVLFSHFTTVFKK